MQDSTNSSPSRTLVIGLDGATWAIARPLMEQGRMPNLARLVSQGTAGPLASTVPPISAAAWVTFLTGQNPGRHGVYQFRKFDLRQYGGYRDEFATSHDYAGRSFLELISQVGKRVAAIGVPMTYPPFPVNGFLVSGFPRPFGPQAQVYPPEMAQRLGRWDEMPDNFNFDLSPAKTLEAADYWVQRYTDIALEAMDQETYDLTVVVWNSTDNIPHLYWKYTDPSYVAFDAEGAREFGDVIQHQYETADRQIGRLLAALPNPDRATVLVMSDHGMGPYPHRQVHLNAWLADQGLLAQRTGASSRPSLADRTLRSLRRRLPTQWRQRLRERLPVQTRVGLYARQMNLTSIDWSRTQAYRFKVFPSVEGLVVNLRGRQAEGIVEPGRAYESLRDRLLAGLADLRHPETGDLIVYRASRREELFSGPFLEDIPDVIVELHEAYSGGDALTEPLVTQLSMDLLSEYSASHHRDGMFALRGPGIVSGQWLTGASIVDLAPTLLHTMGLPVADTMDGRVLQEVFLPAFRRSVEVGQYAKVSLDHQRGGLDSEDEAAIREQLAALGYLRE